MWSRVFRVVLSQPYYQQFMQNLHIAGRVSFAYTVHARLRLISSAVHYCTRPWTSVAPRFQPQIDRRRVQNRRILLWTVISEYNWEWSGRKSFFFWISNISVPCPHAQLRGRTVIKKLWTFLGPWGRDRSQSPPYWIFRVKQVGLHQYMASGRTTRLELVEMFSVIKGSIPLYMIDRSAWLLCRFA